ncbi:hypothetical protein HQN90_11910 [Paenibacillus alba]|uniref:hypothetical protein n=1 Tax=Paenibacillus alba TaxID=1197127 RepID=UPI001C206292|nr:hypothetical protein [Paenibacillus alba]NQX66829.1 hypothetical protein [Paenibacillus alba]
MWFKKKKTKQQPRASVPSTAAPIPASPPSNQAKPASLPSTPTKPDSTSLYVQQLERRLKKLEDELANLTAKHPQIRIDTLHVHQPVLENLTFRLDHLDIKELSGSLNLGNNFGAKPNEKKGPLDEALKHVQVSKDAKQAAHPTGGESAAEQSTDSGSQTGGGTKHSASSGSPHSERTSTGYRFTSPSKTE